MVRPRRSVLYMPGSNERALQKATAILADALILDLEDAVAPDEKAAARRAGCRDGARQALWRARGGNPGECPRDALGDRRSPHGGGGGARCDPGASCRDRAIRIRRRRSRSLHAAPATRLWAMMETPASILNARDIAAVAADPDQLRVPGARDQRSPGESRARALGNRFAIVPWLAMSVLAAWAYGLTSSTASTTISATRPAFARNASRGGPSAWTARR